MRTLTTLLLLAGFAGLPTASAQDVAEDAAVVAAVRHVAAQLHGHKGVLMAEIGVDVQLSPTARQPEAAVRFASIMGATPVDTDRILACADPTTTHACGDMPQVVIKIFRNMRRSGNTAEVGINLIENLGGMRRPSEHVMILSMQHSGTGWKVAKVTTEFIS